MSAHIAVTKWGLDIRCDTCLYQNGLPLIPCDNGTVCLARIGYTRGNSPPNFPVPAIRSMVSNAQRLISFGEISAENGFDIPTVFETFVRLK